MSAAKLFVVPAGEAIKVGETNAGWVHVFRANGQDGWIYHGLIAGSSAAPSTAPARPVAVARATSSRVVGHLGEVRSSIAALEAPAGNAPPAFVLEPGDRFRITQARGSWLLVETEDGDSGWIPG